MAKTPEQTNSGKHDARDCCRASSAHLSGSWHSAHFLVAILLSSTICTAQSVSHQENVLRTQACTPGSSLRELVDKKEVMRYNVFIVLKTKIMVKPYTDTRTPNLQIEFPRTDADHFAERAADVAEEAMEVQKQVDMRASGGVVIRGAQRSNRVAVESGTTPPYANVVSLSSRRK